MTQEEKMVAAMVAQLSDEDKARYEATLQKIMNTVDVTSEADVIALSASYVKIVAMV